MKGDIPNVAVRLSCELPSHKHERVFHTYRQGAKQVPSIKIGDRVFRSRSAVREHFRIGAATLNDWISRGKAIIL